MNQKREIRISNEQCVNNKIVISESRNWRFLSSPKPNHPACHHPPAPLVRHKDDVEIIEELTFKWVLTRKFLRQASVPPKLSCAKSFVLQLNRLCPLWIDSIRADCNASSERCVSSRMEWTSRQNKFLQRMPDQVEDTLWQQSASHAAGLLKWHWRTRHVRRLPWNKPFYLLSSDRLSSAALRQLNVQPEFLEWDKTTCRLGNTLILYVFTLVIIFVYWPLPRS